MIGILLGSLAALCFAIGSLAARVGMRTRDPDDGAFMSNLRIAPSLIGLYSM